MVSWFAWLSSPCFSLPLLCLFFIQLTLLLHNAFFSSSSSSLLPALYLKHIIVLPLLFITPSLLQALYLDSWFFYYFLNSKFANKKIWYIYCLAFVFNGCDIMPEKVFI
jgi:hypothetical protein